MFHFFAMLSRMKYIRRWGLMRNTREENLSEHSFETAILAHALVLIHNREFGGNLNADRAATLALFHDAPEIITGDLPTPVKYYNRDVRDSYALVEDMAQQKLISLLPEEYRNVYAGIILAEAKDDPLYRFVKAADKLSALIKCLEEERSGNTEFRQAEKSTRAALEAMHLPEADYFIENYLPSYQLTLDEQDH